MAETSKPDNKNAPFGYRWQDGSLVLEEREAAARHLMIELFLRHRRKKTVARLLNEAGCRTRSGALFSDTAVDRILRDDSVAPAGEPLVSKEMREQIRTLLDSPQRFGKLTTRLFAGFVACSCGGKMNVPSNSPKYVCEKCRRKIGTDDMEEIFESQLESFPVSQKIPAISGSGAPAPPATLAHTWQALTTEEKRILVEQFLSRITVGDKAVHIEFGIKPDSLKMMLDGQQQTRAAKGQQENLGEEPETKNELETGREPVTAPPTAQKSVLSLTEPLMNETAAAKFLGISRMTLLRKRNAGEIKFFRVGFRVLYSKEKHLAPFLASCEQTGGEKR